MPDPREMINELKRMLANPGLHPNAVDSARKSLAYWQSMLDGGYYARCQESEIGR